MNRIKKMKPLLHRTFISVVAFVIVAVYAAVALNLSLFNPISKAFGDYSINDFYYQVLETTAQPDTSHLVTIVDMTEVTSRRDFADILKEIDRQNPKSVGVDIVFEGLKEDSLSDEVLAMTAVGLRNMVFSYKLIDDSYSNGSYHESVRSYFASEGHIDEGFTNMPRNIYGGMKRSLSLARSLDGKLQPSLIKRVTDIYADKEISPLSEKDVAINFSPMAFYVVPFDSISQNRHLLEDRIVLLGAMHEEADMHYTPVGKIAGVKLLAYGVETLVKGNELQEIPLWLTALFSLLVVVLSKCVFDGYDAFAASRGVFLSVLLNLSLVKGLFRFFWMALIIWIAFILFCRYNWSINTLYALSAIAFLGQADNIYQSFLKYLKSKNK